MQVVKFIHEIDTIVGKLKSDGKTIGLVPTMGALHNGHMSLVKECRSGNDVCIVSIFVNPTQFNDKNDLKNYPRMLEKDFKLLKNVGCDFVFCPEPDEMYPEPDQRVFDFGNLDKVMEGAHRPGHFNGVAQIVTKLFEAIKAHNAYFGEKDFQQLAIIKYLVKTLKLPINIVSCKIVREIDGLAMSSRNLLLETQERIAAPLIYKTLLQSVTLSKELTLNALKNWVVENINKSKFLKVEYFEIVDNVELQPLKNWDEKRNKVGCIAVKAGAIRLIDNIKYNF